MRFKTALIVALVIPAALTGCFGDGGTGQGTEYDGSWTASYSNPADIPVAGTDQTVTCNQPTATLVLVNGTGSTSQTLTCTTTTRIYDSTGALVDTIVVTQGFAYLISVAINSIGTVNAIVNGTPLTGTCISTIGCSAHTSTTSLSLTR